VLAATGFAGIVIFQLALASGVDGGHAAWGGGHADLTTGQRVGSAVAAVVWAVAALVILGRAGLWRAGRSMSLFRRGTWFFVVLLAIGAVLNFASQSRWESLLLGPLSLLLAILCIVVARSGADSTRHDVGAAGAVGAR
jgi:hypothetical protein